MLRCAASALVLAAAAVGTATVSSAQTARPHAEPAAAAARPALLDLLAAVESARGPARVEAVLALGRARDRGARPYLEALLADDRFARRWLALGTSGDPVALGTAVRAAAALGLARLADPRSRSFLDGFALRPHALSVELHAAVCLAVGLASCAAEAPLDRDSLMRLGELARRDGLAAESRAILLLVLPLRYPGTRAVERLTADAAAPTPPGQTAGEPVLLVARRSPPTGARFIALLGDPEQASRRLEIATELLRAAAHERALRRGLPLHEHSSPELARDDPIP